MSAAQRGNKNALGNVGGGRTTDYGPHIVEKTKAYIELCVESLKGPTYKHKLPQIAGLALALDVDKNTVRAWAKLHIEFFHLVRKIEAMQEELLNEGGVNGTYNSNMSRFILNAKHGYAETTKHQVGDIQDDDDLEGLSNEELERIARGG